MHAGAAVPPCESARGRRRCGALAADATRIALSAAPADKAVVVHVSVAPLVLTLLAEPEANVGLLLDAVPRLRAAVDGIAACLR
jgi:hypothetical protein